jgi:hypothetical protein
LPNSSSAIYAEPGYLLCLRNGNLPAQRFNPRRLALEGEATPLADHVPVVPPGFANLSASTNGVLVNRAATFGTDTQPIWLDCVGRPGEPVIAEAA